jgi:uncharacterized membrane protein YecN with MAPEG domain
MITGFYAALLTLLFIFLSINVIRERRGKGVAYGHGDDASLSRAIRAHGHFAEYVPLCLVLMFILEFGGIFPWLLHIMGIILLLGRVAHAYGMVKMEGRSHLGRKAFKGRVVGMMCTFSVMTIGAFSLLWQFFFSEY